MKKVVVNLKKSERLLLNQKRKETLSQRIRNRIEILLQSDKGKSNDEIVEYLGIAKQTILNTKLNYLRHGFDRSLVEASRSGRPVTYGVDAQTELTAIACSEPPKGRDHWTAELLMEEMKATAKGCEKISDEQVRLMLKKMIVSPGKLKSGVLEKLTRNTGRECIAS